MAEWWKSAPVIPDAPTLQPAKAGDDWWRAAPMLDSQAATPSPTSAPSPARDAALAFPSGVARGAAELAMLPVTANRLLQSGVDYLWDKADPVVRHFLGARPLPEGELQRRRDAVPSLDGEAFGAQDAARDAMNGVLYEPKTTAGEYARTIGEFAPSAAIGPGSVAFKAAGNMLVPAVASETAGQLTEGTKAEPWARFLGGLGGNLAATGARAYANADNAAAATAARGVSPEEYAAAQRLQETGARIGVPLSGPEAVQEATRGATKLADLQRVVEGSMSGGQTTARFYAGRPEQVATAANSAFDAIAPASAAPSTLGPRAAVAARGALDDTERQINAVTRPAYRTAEGHVLSDADFEPIARDPAFQASLRRLRSDEVLGPTFERQPDNSIAVIDAVTKDMRDRGVALGNSANPGFSSQTAGMYGSGAAEARDIARTPARGGSQAYDDALAIQSQARRQVLEPLEQGPLGRIASANTTQGAYGEILPRNPLTGGTDEVLNAILRTREQEAGLPASLVRQSLSDSFDEARRRIATGENQSVAGRFANDVAGTPQQRTNLDAVLGAVGSPEAQPRMNDLLDVFRATSQRKPMGSPTEPNRMVNESLDRVSVPMSVAAAPMSAGTSIFSEARNRVRMYARDRAHNQLAELFTAPDSVQQIQSLGARTGETPLAAMFARQAAQTPATVGY